MLHRARPNLEVILKISERCNLACDYCYFFFGGDETYKTRMPTIHDDTIGNLGKFLREGALSNGIKNIKIALHGGEPLLMKPDRFCSMLDQLRETLCDVASIEFGMQTNGVLLNDNWIKILSKYKVGVGISLDGPKEINDIHRQTHRSRGSYDGAVRGLRLLQEANRCGLLPEPGLLCVINPDVDGGLIYRHFTQSLKVRNLNFLLPDHTHDTELEENYVSSIAAYRRGVFYQWVKDKDYGVSVRFIYSALHRLLSYNDPGPEFGVTDLCNLISISSNGDIGPEDVIRTLDDRFRNMGMNISQNTLSDVLASAVWAEMTDAASTYPEDCLSCRWLNVCKGGHLWNRFSKAKGFEKKSIYCDALYEFYETASKSLEKGLVKKQEEANKMSKEFVIGA